MEFGIPNDVAQPIFFTLVGAVALLLVWFVFIRKDRTFEKVYEAFAQRSGLVFTPPVSVGWHTIGMERHLLSGAIQGVPIQVAGDYLRNARAAGVQGKTSFACKTHASVQPFRVRISRRGRAQGGIPTGDARFDAFFLVESDAPEGAQRLLDPNVRACFALMPSSWPECLVHVAPGEVSFAFPDFAFQEAELDFGTRLVLAAAYVRFA